MLGCVIECKLNSKYNKLTLFWASYIISDNKVYNLLLFGVKISKVEPDNVLMKSLIININNHDDNPIKRYLLVTERACFKRDEKKLILKYCDI